MSEAAPQKRRVEDQMIRIFGVDIKGWVQILIVISSLAFAVGEVKRTIKATDYLIGFAEKSDRYHTLVHGVRFVQGEPEDKSYNLQPIRNLLERTVNGQEVRAK